MKKINLFSNCRFKISDVRLNSHSATRQSAIGNRQLLGIALGMSISLVASASHFDGSRTTPVHRIPLTAEDGTKIVSSVPDSMPFSAKMTCGACHDYEEIHGGTHFKGTGQGRPTEPWIVVDEKTGVQVPAERMNLSDWEFTKQFGSHLPGGSISDPEDRNADPDARWEISGGLEMNCLACHNQSHKQDMSEWAKQVARENFRWAASAAAGMGEVGGMASRMPDWWDMYMGGSLDDHVYRVPPSVDYDATLFDSKHYMWFDIGRPQDKNCVQCHSSHPVTAQRMDVPGDVHAAAGLSCVDCHRNGEDHQILRGTTETMSCAACHTEEGEIAGQAGAPVAHHKGLPPIHFEELTCTACHSGLKPGDEPQVVRTSRANKLGIYGRAQWYTESPFIVEPVYVRNDEGKIEPRRMMWPAFWADSEGNPLAEEAVAEAAVGILDAPQQIGAVLSSFGNAEGALGEPVFIACSKVYALNMDGGLDVVGTSDLKVSWAWKTETNVVSSIPVFDVNAEEIDYDTEGIIIGIMDALKPLDVILVTEGRKFTVDADGYVVGTNSTLASGWYTADGKHLIPGFVEQAVTDTVGSTKAFNEEQVVMMLKKLGNGASYISNGRKFDLSGDTLTDSDHEAAEPVSWAIGHDVRGTAQSLGAKACQECHSSDSAFLFGTVTATGPLLTEKAKSVPMHEFQEVNSSFNKLFGTTFTVRKMFKCFLGNISLLLILIGLAVGLPVIYKMVTKLEEKDFPVHPVKVVLMASMLVLIITGFLFGWPIKPALGGFPLLSHVGFGALYALAMLVYAILKAKNGGFWFWVLLVSAIVLILSVLIAMFPLLGTHGQHVAIVVHRCAAVVSIIAAVMGCFSAKKKQND
ncbi:cytochrome c3 family protein [Pontiellaceae bacterium B12227]|nr:cytochrome c3 family protein [Pontiellaceae bacterium B12227]